MWKLSVISWAFEAARGGFGPAQTRGVKMTLEEAVQKIAEIGFDGVELVIWDIDAFDKSRRAKLREEIESLGIEVSSIGCNDNTYIWNTPVWTNPDAKVRDEMVRRVRQTIAAALEWNCGLVGLWTGSDTIPLKTPYRKAWDLLVDSFSRCARIAEEHKVRLAAEYKLENILGNADSTLRLIQDVNSEFLGALMDTGHSLVAREHLPTVADMLGDKLFHVHVDDNYGDWDRDMPPGTVHDFTGFLEQLNRVGYKGYLSMDVWPYEDAEKEVRMGRDYLLRAMRHIG
jgi:xylose isomerase